MTNATGTLLVQPAMGLSDRAAMSRRAFLVGLGSCVAATALPIVGSTPARAATTTYGDPSLAAAAAAKPKPLLGGFSADPTWYDANVGPVSIYRGYDPRFESPVWSDTYLAREYPNARYDWSFNLPPANVASGACDARLRTFIASTPKNIVMTNWHEPEAAIEAGRFSPQQFKQAIKRLAKLVREQNARDGGNRKVSVVLMDYTVLGGKGRNPLNYWPGRDAAGVNYANYISFDTYAQPIDTDTAGVPKGYTDGKWWRTPQDLLDPLVAFAKKLESPWMISEFAYLEDVNNPLHRADAIADFVNYARLHGAHAVQYWDGQGRRADWRLRHGLNAVKAWRAAIAAP